MPSSWNVNHGAWNYDVKVRGDTELILYLNHITPLVKEEIKFGLDDVGHYLTQETQKKFGTYQRSWPKLKRASVIAKWHRRAQLNGFKRANFQHLVGMFNQGFGDDPLVLSGELRDSIDYEVNEANLSTTIFSDVPYAAVHEYGHGPVPARSYLRLTLWDNEDYIRKVISSRIGRLVR